MAAMCFGVFASFVLAACGPGSSRPVGTSASSGNGAPCQSQGDCPSGQTCLTVGGVSACTISCTASATECTGSASCGSFGSVSASVCRPATMSSSSADASAAPRADEQPKAPCRADAECVRLQEGSICGAFRGERACTIACSERSQCNPPAVQGIVTNFMDCVTDEANPARRICAPDPACLQPSNPFACVTFPMMPPNPFDDAGF
ncbi:MAG: hypothetical protein JNK05_36235 [Myxococcales bacterium]|nr:hypothetical protein [Myxococcales bacterium]